MCDAFLDGGPLNNVGGGSRAVVVLFWPASLGLAVGGEWPSPIGVSSCGIFRDEPAILIMAESWCSHQSFVCLRYYCIDQSRGRSEVETASQSL